MNGIASASALTLSLLLAACGEDQTAAPANRQASQPGTTNGAAETVYSAAGKVTAISGDQVTISHGPVEGIGWPAMTMAFQADSPEMTQGVSVGDQVSFAFRQDGSAYTLTSLSKVR